MRPYVVRSHFRRLLLAPSRQAVPAVLVRYFALKPHIYLGRYFALPRYDALNAYRSFVRRSLDFVAVLIRVYLYLPQLLVVVHYLDRYVVDSYVLDFARLFSVVAYAVLVRYSAQTYAVSVQVLQRAYRQSRYAHYSARVLFLCLLRRLALVLRRIEDVRYLYRVVDRRSYVRIPRIGYRKLYLYVICSDSRQLGYYRSRRASVSYRILRRYALYAVLDFAVLFVLDLALLPVYRQALVVAQPVRLVVYYRQLFLAAYLYLDFYAKSQEFERQLLLAYVAFPELCAHFRAAHRLARHIRLASVCVSHLEY